MAWQRPLRWIVAVIGVLSMAIGTSCDEQLDEPSEVKTLRVLAVRADSPYPQPGEQTTLRLTYADALGEAPRPIEVTWMTGCVLPAGRAYYECYPELAAQLFGPGGPDPASSWEIRREILDPEWSGVPDAAVHTLRIPDDALAAGVSYATAYVFFTVCAGELRPAPAAEGDGVATFPLVCVDAAGNDLGPESFVPGFTELYVFADGRTNANPPIDGITVGSVVASDAPAQALSVALCPETGEGEGCRSRDAQTTSCAVYTIGAIVPDAAEVVPGTAAADGSPLRETMWVNYYADGGSFDRNEALVSDASLGYQPSHGVKWIPPAEPGLVTLWAVVHDTRGGAGVRRVFVQVE